MEVQTEQTTNTNVEPQVGNTQTQETETQEVTTQQAQTTTQENTGDDLGFNEQQKAYIESLRKENAKHRTRNKELETQVNSTSDKLTQFESGLKKLFGGESDQDMTPDQQIEALTAHNEQLEINQAVTEVALEYGVGKDDMSFFKFKLNEALAELEDGEELSEEDLEAVIAEVRTKSAKPANTSVEGGNPNTSEMADESGDITVEQFAAMGIGEKSMLYQKDKDLYNKLSAAAKGAGKLI